MTGGRVYVTTVTTDGKSKPPQIGTEYSNEYVAELMKQGLPEAEVIKRVTERDAELPHEVFLHYFLYCLNLKSGKVEWQKEFHTGRPPGGRHRKNSFVSESPVTDGRHVYVYVANLGLWAFDLKGKQAWSTPLEANPIYLDFGTERQRETAIHRGVRHANGQAGLAHKSGPRRHRTARATVRMGDAFCLAARAAHRNRGGWARGGRKLRPGGKRVVAHVGNFRDPDTDALRLRRITLY